jgi:alpha-L-fucosidase 2
MKYPASWWKNMWREALPSGNGTVGASVYGAIQDETIMIGHQDLWHWGRKDSLPDVSWTLAQTRKLMVEGKYLEASWNLTNALKEQGYATRLASRFPLADLKLTMPCRHAFRQYERSLNMETGEVTVTWRDGDVTYERNLFVSRADDLIVYEIRTSGCGATDAEGATKATGVADANGGRGVAGATEATGATGADGATCATGADGRFGTDSGTGADGGSADAGGPSVAGEFRLALHKSDKLNPQDERWKELEQSVEVQADGEYICYAAANDDGTDFGAVLRVIASGGRLTTGDGSIRFAGADKVLALVKVFVKGDRRRDWVRLKNELAAASGDYERLLAAHAQIHGRLFRSAALELDAQGDRRSNEELMLEAYNGEAPIALIEKMWAYGRYLFISGTHAQGLPFGMYGLWGGDYSLIWNHNMANENVQMMYWHAPAGGLAELMPALFHYYDSMLDVFRDNARKLYGCRGIYIPAGTTPGIGVPNQIVPVIMNWTGAAGWLARHYYEYYLYTGDLKFLTDKALPFMKEVALFYEDFLVLGEDGYYKFYPSVSPENTPENFMPKDGKPLAHPMPTTINATMDFAIMKELLAHLIEGSRAAGMYADEIGKWENMLKRIPPYQINEDGAIREWMHPAFDDRYDHRHLSHIYPIFPGQEFTREEQPELFEAFAVAVRKRRLGAQSGWSLAHMASIYARLGDGNKALECLDMLTRSCLLNNLFTLHNDWRNMGVCLNMQEAPIQMDANMGVINAVQEMLLYVSPTIVKLLPALPDRWTRGKAVDFRFCTGRISFAWDREKGEFAATLTAERETFVTVKLPEMFENFTWSGDGAEIAPSPLGRHCYTIRMKPGQSVAFRTS